MNGIGGNVNNSSSNQNGNYTNYQVLGTKYHNNQSYDQYLHQGGYPTDPSNQFQAQYYAEDSYNQQYQVHPQYYQDERPQYNGAQAFSEYNNHQGKTQSQDVNGIARQYQDYGQEQDYYYYVSDQNDGYYTYQDGDLDQYGSQNQGNNNKNQSNYFYQDYECPTSSANGEKRSENKARGQSDNVSQRENQEAF